LTHSAATLARLLDSHGLAPSRALGQNFVGDPNTVRRIARLAAVGAGDRVVEVGAGLGSLTLALAETGAQVTAIEVDRHLVPVLEEIVAGKGVRVVRADALRADWDDILAGGDRWVLVANLPYNIATPLVADILDQVPAIARMVVMVQREVGERLAAGPGDPAYGAVSVKVAYWAQARVLGSVPASVFLPRPRVESVLVGIERRAEPPFGTGSPDRFFGLVKSGFSQRRKMLRRSLAGLVPEGAYAVAGIDPHARPETLSVDDWGRLAAAVGL
jgi:16S rRNA (adenine1518-N6/adenine1519-N6)-dimethyltransferase